MKKAPAKKKNGKEKMPMKIDKKTGKEVPAFLKMKKGSMAKKELVGNQKNLNEGLKRAIKASDKDAVAKMKKSMATLKKSMAKLMKDDKAAMKLKKNGAMMIKKASAAMMKNKKSMATMKKKSAMMMKKMASSAAKMGHKKK